MLPKAPLAAGAPEAAEGKVLSASASYPPEAAVKNCKAHPQLHELDLYLQCRAPCQTVLEDPRQVGGQGSLCVGLRPPPAITASALVFASVR